MWICGLNKWKKAEHLIILTNWCFYVTLLYKNPEIRSLERRLTCKMTLINMQPWERYRSWWNPTEAAQEMFHLSLSHCTGLNASSLPPLHLLPPPPLVSKITNDCTKTHNTNLDIKFADRTTVIELMHHGDESAYRDEACWPSQWSSIINLPINVSKTKELISFRRQKNVPSCRQRHCGDSAKL